MHYFIIFIIFTLSIINLNLFIFPDISESREKIITFEFKIYPKVKKSKCASIPEIDQDKIFLELITIKRSTLKSHNYNDFKEFDKCTQIYKAEFPTPESLYKFVVNLAPSPQYPFYSGADYNIYIELMKLAVRLSDHTLYKILMSKDTLNSASELDASIYSILRKNSLLFLETFSQMSLKEQQIVICTHYDHHKVI